jgi:NAD(P)-dependent dehydrogenase (short-subunit alcohol dehydrogenase family)
MESATAPLVTTTTSTTSTARTVAAPASGGKTWRAAIVVGASSGMGAEIAKQLAAQGCTVAAIARSAEALDDLARSSGGRIVAHAHDVMRADEVPDLFERIVRELGGLDLIVYAAGIMPKVGPREYDTQKDLDQLAVNVGGCMAWCNAAANLFQTQRHGTIVGIGSIAGDRGRKGNPAYCTTKAAMNTYLESLRNRLSESGVHVCTIRPGFVDTRMTQGMGKLLWLIPASRAAELILRAARTKANVRYVPKQWWFVGTVIKCIPSFLFKKLNI